MTRIRLTPIALALAALPLHAIADPLRHVDPRIGVVGDGATVIGPSLPFGSVHPAPDTARGDNDGYRPDQPIRGFSQLHVSGTGWGQYGNFLISPQVGLNTVPGTYDSAKADERAEAHQYSVRLTRHGIGAELAPTRNAVIYRFRFPASDDAHIVFDAVQHIPGHINESMMAQYRTPVPARLELSADGRSLSGHARFPGGFGGPYQAYYYAEIDRAPSAFGTWRDKALQPGARRIDSSGTLEHLGSYGRFDTRDGRPVTMKIAVSFRSVEHARATLAREIPGWNYEAVRDAGARHWREALGAIDVQGGTDAERTIFYTALYHAHVMPRDRTGQFERFPDTAPMWDDHYAIWDTWRTLYPLYALIRPDVVRDTVNSFIARQQADGAVPDTFIAGVPQFREQGGNGTDMIIADAHAKGIAGVDWHKAYEVIRHNADRRRTGPHFDNPGKGPGPYRELGWIPAGIMSNSMSLEYSYNDFAAAQVAEALGQADDARRWRERSRKWTSLWNPDAADAGFQGFTMPRKADGTWIDVDTRKYGGSWKPHFYESNAWTYSYFVPHQAAMLVERMGGRQRFIERLEYAFANNLIDTFNEPSFLVPQLFHYVNRPDLSARWLQRITGEKFTLKGYPGDDDSGAMSSYYVWSRLGLFPNAGQDVYFLNGPAFDALAVRRPGKADLQITRSGEGIYVAGVTLDGKPHERSWLRHAELDRTHRLHFTMSAMPTAWATRSAPPPSMP
ncbi:GH92 family glycosyl hydrolase [Pseudoduganella lutea]|uniref:Alpha-mannosidase n=1 Tax=Pseudoduganella lutea TaxID=321985 RepID=A0A4P6KS43_9BURK|nr:GH92 family glycosyl hydrolase [Pseudoduganella lutea]QBE61931.1 alpha-mannosidase [Pseudoduganella lutea]